jgi:hypothetical protein
MVVKIKATMIWRVFANLNFAWLLTALTQTVTATCDINAALNYTPAKPNASADFSAATNYYMTSGRITEISIC